MGRVSYNKHQKEIDELKKLNKDLDSYFGSYGVVLNENPWDQVDNVKKETFDSQIDRFISEHLEK